jgi:hypothetical protein
MLDDGLFEKGQKLWYHGAGGETRPCIYVGDGDNTTFLGGPPMAYIVFEDTRDGAEVALDQITARD